MKSRRLYWCRLCGFIADDEEELMFHYEIAHEERGEMDDLISEDDVW